METFVLFNDIVNTTLIMLQMWSVTVIQERNYITVESHNAKHVLF
jgi:hypothetical protein